MADIRFVSSTENNYWQDRSVTNESFEDTLEVQEDYRQTVLGFGGCFNEIGWEALKALTDEERDSVFNTLFTREGLNFNSGRLPMGASDYALEWYSYDETDNDYELRNFSIERDKQYLMPYVREALKKCPGLSLFASPWSPPTWLKTKKVYNYSVIKQDSRSLDTYADYFVKYIEAYRAEGIEIEQVHIQNEPMADQKFPSCKWTGEAYRDFIKNHIGPLFAKLKIPVEIWVGTINGPFLDMQFGGTSFSEFYDGFINTILSDRDTRKYIAGCGFQWGGKHVLEQTELAYPEMRIMQTENECGDGKNTWTHAEYVFSLMWQYFRHSAERYVYWNMVLPEGGVSTWGWEQNTMITINPDSHEVKFNPEFYIMKHLSHFIKKGAKYVPAKGHMASNSIVFENPGGETIIAVGNAMDRERSFTCIVKGRKFSAVVPAHSVNTFVVYS